MVVVEALAYGLPVITTKSSSWKDLDDYNAGYWVDIDKEHIKKALTNMVNLSNESLNQYCNNAEKLIKKKYLWDEISKKTIVLPSVSEPWGLVVEGALHHDCVLLLSQMIGSNTELLTEPETGCIFDPENEKSLMDAIHNIEQNYYTYYENVQNFNINEKDVHQINSYLELLK